MVTGCEGVVDDVKASQTAQLVGLVLDQPCVLTPREGRRLAGAYLRQPTAAPDGYDPIFITGRENKAGLPRSVVFDDKAVRRMNANTQTGDLAGSRRSNAVPRAGFAAPNSLPNVYDLTYRADKIDYQGALVVGNSMAAFEVPTSGAQRFTGRIEVTLKTPNGRGGSISRSATGTFVMNTGYGSKRAQFTAQGLRAGLPFDRLNWTNLYLCGTRIVSSGEGEVTIASPNVAATAPFQSEGAPVALRSVFESSIFAPEARPAAPANIGGVLVVQSDAGTITGVFLSSQPSAGGGS